MNAVIHTLLDKNDNAEKIRDMIAGILKTEFVNQYDVALKSGSPNAQDFNVGVYLENARPWESTENEARESPFPLVNICLNETRKAEGKAGSAIGRKKYVASFFIDCYACGNFASGGNDTEQAALKAWRVAAVVRNILMSGYYAYLGMRGVVLERDLLGIKTGSPGNLDESALAVTVARMEFSVSFYEDSPQAEGVVIEGINFETVTKTGEVLIKI